MKRTISDPHSFSSTTVRMDYHTVADLSPHDDSSVVRTVLVRMRGPMPVASAALTSQPIAKPLDAFLHITAVRRPIRNFFPSNPSTAPTQTGHRHFVSHDTF